MSRVQNSLGDGNQGYDSQGYDRSGFNIRGVDREGYDRAGFNQNGLNRAGFDKSGRNLAGDNVRGTYIGKWKCCGDPKNKGKYNPDPRTHDVPGENVGPGVDVFCDEHNHVRCLGEANGCKRLYDDGSERPKPVVSQQIMISANFQALLTHVIASIQTPFSYSVDKAQGSKT